MAYDERLAERVCNQLARRKGVVERKMFGGTPTCGLSASGRGVRADVGAEVSDVGGLFRGFDLDAAIAAEAQNHGVALAPAACAALVHHALAVAGDEHLHLSAIDDPAEFVARHIGEAFEGAAMLGPGVEGRLVDLGSGNGYPGLPLALACPGLCAVLVDASARRAAFLEEVVRDLAGVEAECAQVQRSADLVVLMPIRVLTMRAVGAWQKIVPRLAASLGDDGELLLWAGADVETLAQRTSWRRLRLVDRRLLAGRERSWIWRFRQATRSVVEQ